MSELFPREKGTPGRRQTCSAKAWIERSDTGVFISRVSLGKGRIYDLSTRTRIRSAALDFNRTHLLHLLSKSKGGRRSEIGDRKPGTNPPPSAL